MSMNRIFFILVFLSVMISCRDNSVSTSSFPKVEFYYLEKSLETMNSINTPEKFLSHDCLDTVVTDSCSVDSFIRIVDMLIDDSVNDNCDIRVLARIFYSDSVDKVVCLGGYHGIKVDNVPKKHSPELYEYINKLLFDEDGWRKIIIHYLRQDGFGDDIDTPEMQTMIDECMERVRKSGDVYPK